MYSLTVARFKTSVKVNRVGFKIIFQTIKLKIQNCVIDQKY